MFNPLVILTGAIVGFVVGLTGMGGGALMTPILVLIFGIEPLPAVSSDIVAAMLMRPIGGAVHWQRGTVHRGLVKWLMIGSIPSAFLGVVLLRHLGSGSMLQAEIRFSLAIALLVVSAGLILRPLLAARRKQIEDPSPLVVKPIPTVLIGIAGGLVVGLTSVGSGSLMIILLLMLYPQLKLSQLVGTDLVQAIPLITSAAIGHLLFGNCELGLIASILIGGVPGIFLGARLSSRAPDRIIRPGLVVVLFLSGIKLIGVPDRVFAVLAPLVLAAGIGYVLWAVRRARAADAALSAAPSPGQSAESSSSDPASVGVQVQSRENVVDTIH